MCKRQSIEVLDRQRDLRRKAAQRELKALERRRRELRKQVAADSNQSGLSSSEQEDSRSISDSDCESLVLKLPLALEGSCHPPLKGGSRPPQKGGNATVVLPAPRAHHRGLRS